MKNVFGSGQSCEARASNSSRAPLAREQTDAEILCQFMEPKPATSADAVASKWWAWLSGPNAVLYVCDPLTALGRLWEIEDQLDAEQWQDYLAALMAIQSRDPKTLGTVHATPEQKIRALAAALRPVVEGKP